MSVITTSLQLYALVYVWRKYHQGQTGYALFFLIWSYIAIETAGSVWWILTARYGAQ